MKEEVKQMRQIKFCTLTLKPVDGDSAEVIHVFLWKTPDLAHLFDFVWLFWRS